MGSVLMHQGIGLDAFNAWSERKAVHALYECCNSTSAARSLAAGRPYDSHLALFSRADTWVFSMSDATIDQILEACPHVGRRPRSTRSVAEQCSVWDDDDAVMTELRSAAKDYETRFGFGFVMFVDGAGAAEVLSALGDRLHNDSETERKVVRNELARIHRSRLERMLGPEGGYLNW